MLKISKNFLTTIIASSMSLLVVSCGSSGPVGNGNAKPPQIGGGSSSSSANAQPSTQWTKGVYKPSASYQNYCKTPRTGTNPYTGESYADKQGSVALQNHFLRSWSYEDYLWYDELPDLDPNDYSDSKNYFSFLKTDAKTAGGKDKDQFHFTEDEIEGDQFTYTGESGGYGINWLFTKEGEAFVIYVDKNTPASKANIQRGMQLISVDGIKLASALPSSQITKINEALFPELDDSHSFEFSTLLGGNIKPTLTAETINVSPVFEAKTLNTAFGKVGYLMLNNFSSLIAASQFKTAFNNFKVNGIQDLVVDLRYNPGGYIYLSSLLAYLTAGDAATQNKTFARLEFNDNRSDENVDVPFYSEIEIANEQTEAITGVELGRVYVLTGNNTCSASEYFINGLRGIGIEVIQIGETTCGKPYGFEGEANCGTRYFSINFESVNNEDFGNFADGFEPVTSGGDPFSAKINGCPVADDLAFTLGTTSEKLLSAALFYRENGRCPSASSAIQKTSQSLTVKGVLAIPESQQVARLKP